MASSLVSSSNTTRYHFIYDLPYPERKQLEKILDSDGKWEELGGRFMGQTQMDLNLIGRSVFSNGSPTSVLLDKFARINGTIDKLFLMLNKMNHQRAMTAISAYVSQKHHHLLCNSLSMDSKEFITCKPTAPSKSQMPFCRSCEGKHSFAMSSDFTKLALDPENFNHSQGASSFPPKSMNDYSTTREKTRDYYPETNGTASHSQNESRLPFPTKQSSPIENFPSSLPEAASKDNKVVRPREKRPQMKLNIPVSQPQNGATKKINREAETRAEVRRNSEELSTLIIEIPYEELLKATDNFHQERILGQGGFGIVYKADWKGNAVAVKRISPKNKTDPHFAGLISIKQSLTEMRVLYTYRIDNILPLYGASLKGPEPCLVYQFMVNGSLEDRLLCKAKSKPLTWDQRSNISKGTAKGLNYLHTVPDKPLVHGDIKSANILLDVNMEPKIGDFGLAREGPTRDATHLKVSSVHGTQFYLPAEYLRNFQLSPKVDVYSFGIVLLEIATGQRVYNDKLQRNKHLLERVSETKEEDIDTWRDIKAGEENYEWFEEIFRLGKMCSAVKKNHRPDMGEVLEKIQRSQQKIDMIGRVRKLSREMPESPGPLSPMELQMLYDMRNRSYPAGIMCPPLFVEQDTGAMNLISSFHPSQIREPPSLEPDFMVQYRNPPPPLDSSLAATAGSLPFQDVPPNFTTGTRNTETQNSSSSSDSYIPALTALLGNNHLVTPSSHFSGTSPVLSSDSALSEIPGREAVYTPRTTESNINLDVDDEDLDEDLDDLDDVDYEDSSDSINKNVVSRPNILALG